MHKHKNSAPEPSTGFVPEQQNAQRSWQPVAEWLRGMRARTAGLGDDNPSVRETDSVATFDAPAPSAKLKFRFVCDRHVIGFVFGRK
jgi:hypothetical protein